MEMVTNVRLDLPTIRRVVERDGGCLVRGGALTLSLADDIVIRVELPLDLDSDSQLAASVLSKKRECLDGRLTSIKRICSVGWQHAQL
jgi:thymidine phosphorylase